MKLYAIHAPLVAQAAPEKVRAAKTGFSWAGLIFGPLWLLARGLWAALLIYAAAAAAIFAAVRLAGFAPGAALALSALAHLYVAFEGRGWRTRARARAGRPVADLIFARSALEAEKAFLERLFTHSPPTFRPGAPAASEILGLFPEPGR